MTLTTIAPNQPSASNRSAHKTTDEQIARFVSPASDLPHKASPAHAPTRTRVQARNRTGISIAHQKLTPIADGRQLTGFDQRYPGMACQLGRRRISPKEPMRLKAHLLTDPARPANGASASDATESAPPADEGIDGDE
ncbi:hypothetical protein [Nocardia nepalensis]|uniref:hypothetical protein n=1 Tax=Nocardia nepalensis TaxID=3375448 RepID=UPI003B68356E